MVSLQLQGIVPPVATPYAADGAIDTHSLRRVVRHLLEGGVHGLFALGSTSECVFLTAAQRASVIETIVDEAAGRVPVVAGVIDATTDHCIAQARQAKALGAQGLVLTAPYYTRTSQAEIVDHFGYVQEAAGLPIVAYDIPVCVHVKLERATVAELRRRGLACGLKDSSGDDGNLRMVMQDRSAAGQTPFFVLSGSEIVADAALLGGADGCVPGLANVDPAGYVRLYDAARRGDWAGARREQDRLVALFQIVFQGLPHTSMGASGVGGFKTALQLMGLIEHRHMARPNRLLPDEAVARVRQILVESGLL
ncbi:MAG: dihydrodipicolinate synthase family protein [Pseudomonadota bacterium]